MKNVFKKEVLIIVLIIVAVGGLAGTKYYHDKYQALKVNPNAEAQKQTADMVLAVGKLMELPQGETPTVATISDVTKLADQTFFKSAKNGDVLLAYTAAMEAVIYRPSANMIINVAPISTNQAPNVASPAKQGTQTATTTTTKK